MINVTAVKNYFSCSMLFNVIHMAVTNLRQYVATKKVLQNYATKQIRNHDTCHAVTVCDETTSKLLNTTFKIRNRQTILYSRHQGGNISSNKAQSKHEFELKHSEINDDL